jgi:hypothetical protein
MDAGSPPQGGSPTLHKLWIDENEANDRHENSKNTPVGRQVWRFCDGDAA